MGAGKTTVGAALRASCLDRPFVDTDELVVATRRRPVRRDLRRPTARAAFRALERVAVADACASPEPLVIACGGGAVLDADNRRRCARRGVVVWLDGRARRRSASRVGASDDAAPAARATATAPRRSSASRALRAPAYEAAAARRGRHRGSHASTRSPTRVLEEYAVDASG